MLKMIRGLDVARNCCGSSPLHAQYVQLQLAEVQYVQFSPPHPKHRHLDHSAAVCPTFSEMKLLVATEDYCLLKIRLALALTGKECVIETGVSVEDLKKLDADAKAMLLESSLGYITQHIAILRSIVGSEMVGSTDVDRAMIDQWLEFSWQELGTNKLHIHPNTFF